MFGAMMVLGQMILFIGQWAGWFILAPGDGPEADPGAAASRIQALVFANTFGGLGAVAIIVGLFALLQWRFLPSRFDQ